MSNKNVSKNKYYKNKNKYNKNVSHSNVVVHDKKLTYDDIVNVRQETSEIEVKSNINSFPVMKFVALSITILAIIFGSLLLFRVI